MKVFDKLILVSKESILEKRFGVDKEAYEKLSQKEKDIANIKFPTEDEENFMQVFKSTAPQLARLQRKMSICLDVEVKEYDFDKVIFTYAGNDYTLLEPKNAYRICKAIDDGSLEALQELCKQGCVLINVNPVLDIKSESATIKVDELNMIKNVAEKFFFQTFLA